MSKAVIDEFETPPSTPPCERETDESPRGSSVDLLDGVASQLGKSKREVRSDSLKSLFFEYLAI